MEWNKKVGSIKGNLKMERDGFWEMMMARINTR